MTATSAALLAHPHPCRHIVYPYTDEDLVGRAVGMFAANGLHEGDGIILIMTESNRTAIDRHLEAEGFNPSVLQATGRLVCMLSEDLLSSVMASGKLDHRLFKTIMAYNIASSRALNGINPQSGVRVFCEMVSPLWKVDLAAASDMERVWDEVIETHRIYLLCTYDFRNWRPAAAIVPELGLSGHSYFKEVTGG